MNPQNKLIRWLILVLALSAVAATAAQAGTGQKNDRAGTLGVAPLRAAGDTSDVVSRYLRSHSISPNDRADSLGARSTDVTSPDVFERYASSHPYGVGLAATVTAHDGFRWGDYGAGVGTGMALVLLLAGGLIATPMWRRQARQPVIG
jgi:hypothetical protein